MKKHSTVSKLFLAISFILSFCFQVIAQDSKNAYREGELYVRLKDVFPLPVSAKVSSEVLSFFERKGDPCGFTKVKSTFYFSTNPEIQRTYRVYFSDFSKAEYFIRELEKDPTVEYAEQIPAQRHFFFPDDMGPNSITDGGQWYLYKTRAQQAWDLQTGSSSVTVAVVDDAINIFHQDLEGVCLQGYDVAEGDGDPNPPGAAHDHGTHIAGLIAAKTDNAIGIASLAHGVKILPVKIALDSNPDDPAFGYEGIVWATTNGADIINCSWGNGLISQTELGIIQNAVSAGVLIVAAAGNESNTAVIYPAGYQGVISVAATTNIDSKASYSSYGSWVDISAPGSLIWSLAPFDGYALKSGTSFSAPLVSALAALLLSHDTALSNEAVEQCIKSSADNIDIFSPAYTGQLGAGRINAEQAILCLLSGNTDYDVAVTGILNPANNMCETTFVPVIRIINQGNEVLDTVKFRYQLDTEFPLEYEWTGSLSPGIPQIISFPEMQAPVGSHTFRVNQTGFVNGNKSDAYLPNNDQFIVFEISSPTGVQLPFLETFEAGNFSQTGWSVQNPSSDFTWEVTEAIGLTPGFQSARLPYFIDSSPGQRDYLISPAFNFSGYSAVTLSFKHAYQQRLHGLTDSLIVSISSDCENNWQRLLALGENDSLSFATTALQGSFFVPSEATQWCVTNCQSVNLNGFAGLTGLRLRFEGYNGTGNNIYIDNINITGTVNPTAPVAQFTAAGNTSACVNKEVNFTNTSLFLPQSYLWQFPGGTPDSSTVSNPVVIYSEPGTYSVSLKATNTTGSDSITIADYITIYDIPSITAVSNPDTICNSSSAELTASGGMFYLWNAGPGILAFYDSVVTASPLNTYTYTVTGMSENGCTAQASVEVAVVDPPPQPIITESFNLLMSSPGVAYQWYVNGLIIPDSVSQFLVPTINGNYNVRIYDAHGCTTVSNVARYISVGISETGGNSINVFPNPAKELVFIRNDNSIERMELYSLTGQLVFAENNVGKTQAAVNVTGLSSGIYMLRITNKDGSRQVGRVVVSK